jgi:hypothetical protein
MTPFLSLAIAIAVIAVAFVARRATQRRRVAATAAEPPAGTPRRSRGELAAAYRALCPPDGAIQLIDENGVLTLTWQLIGIPWATLLFRRKLRDTQALDLEVDEAAGVVRVSHRAGRIAWETAAATWMPRAVVRWTPAGGFDPGPLHALSDPPAVPTAESARDFHELIRHVRPVALAHGYRWEPRS